MVTAQSLTSPKPRGVVFGRKDGFVGKPENMDGHVLVVGGVGSGKSSCIAIPTLMSWSARVFAIDIKGELYAKTKRPNAKVFNPFDNTSYGYNPFYLLEMSNNKAQEAMAIAHALIPIPLDIKDPFWVESAQNLLTGAILNFFDLGLSFIETIYKIQSTDMQTLIDEIASSLSDAARLYAIHFTRLESKTLAGIMTEISHHILIFVTDEQLESCFTRDKNITPEDLETQDVDIQIPEKLLRQWKGLLTLMVSQFLTFFEDRPDETSTPILFLLDEFPRLGKIENILDALATLRSKNITICLIIQSLAQLDLIYGKDARRVIADTCAYKAILNALDPDTQDYFSRLVGTYDKIVHGTSQSQQFLFITGTGKSTSTIESRIIKPENFATLENIVLLAPCGWTQVGKVHYSMIG